MDDDRILEINRMYLKEIFFKRICEKNSKVIDKNQFLRFLRNLEVFPSLICAENLEKILSATLRNKGSDAKEITYMRFEELIKNIAYHCFHSTDSIKMFITHVKNMCYLHYKTNLITKIKKQLSLMKTQKILVSSTELLSNKIALKKSTSQKLSFNGTPYSKNITNNTSRLTELSSLSLKFPNSIEKHLTPCPRLPDDKTKVEKLQKISEITLKFQEKYRPILTKRPCQVTPLAFLLKKASLTPNSVSYI